MKKAKPKLTTYITPELDDKVRRLIDIREQTITSFLSDLLEREIDAAIESGELKPDETNC